MSTFTETRDQNRLRSLAHGNDIRSRRARLKRDLRSGEVRIETVLREPEWWLFSVPIATLLIWAPNVGARRVNVLLRRAEVWPLREAGKLTLRQRSRILLQLETVGGIR